MDEREARRAKPLAPGTMAPRHLGRRRLVSLGLCQASHIRFPLLADFEPKGEVSRAYHAYRKGDGYSERALFTIDTAGVISWSYLSPIGVDPGADGIPHALEAMAKKETAA